MLPHPTYSFVSGSVNPETETIPDENAMPFTLDTHQAYKFVTFPIPALPLLDDRESKK